MQPSMAAIASTIATCKSRCIARMDAKEQRVQKTSHHDSRRHQPRRNHREQVCRRRAEREPETPFVNPLRYRVGDDGIEAHGS